MKTKKKPKKPFTHGYNALDRMFINPDDWKRAVRGALICRCPACSDNMYKEDNFFPIGREGMYKFVVQAWIE